VLRVTHIGKFYPPVPGGMERIVQSLCAVTKGRLDNHVLAFNTSSQTVEEVVDGVAVTRVGTWGSAGSVPVAPSFASHLSHIKADVIILHEPNPWALLAYATVRPRLPLAVWFHSDVIRPKLQYDLFYAPVARPAYRDASRFIVSSPVLAERATALQPYRDRVSVIPFGIDLDRWRPTDLVRTRAQDIRKGVTRPIVLFAGRHVPYKGVNILIQAAQSLDVTVVVLGDGPMRGAWEAHASKQNGRATFIFTGEVSDAEMHAHFLACDVFVLPSVTPAEAFGFVQLEAMACGKPVISTALPTGVPWVNETGVVVPPADADALREAIRRLVDDPAMAVRLGAAGQARARAQFTMSEMGDRLVTVCHELAQEGYGGNGHRN
jgi:glycosyltransferase involved in cell wall biosynthesis